MADKDQNPLAVELTRTFSLEDDRKYTFALWENEDLAKVRIQVLRGHTESVNSCDTLINDNVVITASDDKSVKLWKFRSGRLLRSYDDIHSMEVSEARPNHDGLRFVSSGWDKMIKYWDTETGVCLWKYGHGGAATCCKVSYDGKLVCSGSDFDNTVKIADTRTGNIIHHLKDFHKSTVTSCIFSFDNNKVITTSMDRFTKFFDLRSCENTITLDGHTNVVSSCAISRNERSFATTSWDKTINIWDIATGMYRDDGPNVLKGPHDGSVSCSNFSRDCLMLVTGSYDHCIVVWNAEHYVVKLKLQGHQSWVNDVKFSNNQRWLISASKDTTVRLWNIEDSDRIPAVLESKKSIGLKVVTCSKCQKPFSMSQVDDFNELNLCVFCRLQNPEKIYFQLDEPLI